MLSVNSTNSRERLLRVPELTLEKALDVVLCTEATEMQMKELESCMELEGKGHVNQQENTFR